MHYTYILLSKKDNKLYVGYTKDLKLRFERHVNGKVLSTKYRRPVILVYYEACVLEEDAIKREKYFKTHRGRMFLHNRLKSYFIETPQIKIKHEE
ncbi:GIY-YIG nuclease family protein [Patescibacteria group bacterium]